MDCLILCYSCDTPTFDCSNSHKVLEYLSIGRVIVATRIGFYEGRHDLLRMTRLRDGQDFPSLLDETLSNLQSFNSDEAQRRRRDFALAGTYEERVNEIAREIGLLSRLELQPRSR
jgi:hypothetical protein